MYTSETQVRVRYSETDQMGFVYYAHYSTYFEVARVEALRGLGISYASVERDYGILLPVMHMNVRFLRPAFYDDLLTLKTTVPRMPQRDIIFITEVFKHNTRKDRAELVCAGRIALCFLDANTRARVDAPSFITEKLQSYF